MFLPLLLMLLGLGAAAACLAAACPGHGVPGLLAMIGLPVLGLGIGSLIKTFLVYRGHILRRCRWRDCCTR